MSDDSSDEFFASADEEFDNDPDLMLSSHKPVDKEFVKNPRISKSHLHANKYWDSWEDESFPSEDKPVEKPCITDRVAPVDSNPEKVLFKGPLIATEAKNLINTAQPLIYFEEMSKSKVAVNRPNVPIERDFHDVEDDSLTSEKNPTAEGDLISPDLYEVINMQIKEKQAEKVVIEPLERETGGSDVVNPILIPKKFTNISTEDAMDWNNEVDTWGEVTTQQNESTSNMQVLPAFKAIRSAELGRITREFDPFEKMPSTGNKYSRITALKKADRGSKKLKADFVFLEEGVCFRAPSRESKFSESEAIPVVSKSVNVWNDDDPWVELTSQQISSPPMEFASEEARSFKVGALAEEFDPLGVLKEGYIGPKILTKTNTSIPGKGTDLLDAKNDPWLVSKADSSKVKASKGFVPAEQVPSKPSDGESAWNLDDPWMETLPKESENLKSTVNENKPPSVKVEESDAWDLEDDLWTNSDITFSVSPNLKTGDSAEEEANMQDLHAKLSLISAPSNPSQELASAATALVKSVGGGLASFMGGLIPIFENTAAQKSNSHSEMISKPQGDANESSSGGWGAWDLGSIAKALTSTVENTGMQLIHGGVDVLEQIGRKTFETLKENDPGLVYTKRILRQVDASRGFKLSQVLREASDQHTSQLATEPGLSQSEARRGDLAFQLELRLALVHMEALELLSSRASARLTTELTRLEAYHETFDDDVISLTAEGGVLERIWQTLQLKDREADSHGQINASAPGPSTTLSNAVKVLDQVVPGNVLVKTCDEVQKKSRELENDLSMKEIFYRSVEALAESTSAMLAYLHKLSECLLLIGQHRDRFDSGFLDIAEKVAVIITAAKRQNETLCSTYVEHLKRAAVSSDGKDATKTDESGGALTATRRLVASLFLETGMANGYLDDAAANHLVPVLQVACLDAFLHEPSPPRAEGPRRYPLSLTKPKLR